MRKTYISPDLELETFTLREVILSSIIVQDETYASSGVVIIDDDEELEP